MRAAGSALGQGERILPLLGCTLSITAFSVLLLLILLGCLLLFIQRLLISPELSVVSSSWIHVHSVVLQFLRIFPLSQLPTLLQPLKMCGGVQGCWHGSCTIKAERPNNGVVKICCRARSTRTTAPEAASKAKNDNTQNTQHTWAAWHQGKGIGRRQVSFEYARLSTIGNQCKCVAEYKGASMAKRHQKKKQVMDDRSKELADAERVQRVGRLPEAY